MRATCAFALLAAIGLAVGSQGRSLLAASEADLEKLNFALQIKCLQAEFYSLGGYNRQLSQEEAGTSTAAPISGPRTNFPDRAAIGDARVPAQAFSSIKNANMLALRAVLDDRAAPCPTVDLLTSFKSMVSAATTKPAAGSEPALPNLDPFSSNTAFWLAATMLEDVAVTSWLGAVAGMMDMEVQTLAARMMATDSAQAGVARLMLAEDKDDTFEGWAFNVQQIAGNISEWRDVIDKKADLDRNIVEKQDLAAEKAVLNITPLSLDGQAFSRTEQQVKSIFYGSINANKGGFYPDGVNGLLAVPPTRRLLTVDAATLAAKEAQTASLNELLNLECLEAAFHSWAAFGRSLSLVQRRGGVGSEAGTKLGLSLSDMDVPREIAFDEQAHLGVLQRLLGNDAIACPKVDVNDAFANLYAAATADLYGEDGPDATFDPYADAAAFYVAAFMLKDVTLSAYTRVLPQLTEPVVSKEIAGILSAEGYHSGIIRAKMGELENDTLLEERVKDVVKNVAQFQNRQDNSESNPNAVALDDRGRIMFASVDKKGLTTSRTRDQVTSLLVNPDADSATYSFFAAQELAMQPAMEVKNADGTTTYPDQSVLQVDGSIVYVDGSVLSADGTTLTDAEGNVVPVPGADGVVEQPLESTDDTTGEDGIPAPDAAGSGSTAGDEAPGTEAELTPASDAARSAAWGGLAGAAALAAALVC